MRSACGEEGGSDGSVGVGVVGMVVRWDSSGIVSSACVVCS